MDDNYQGVKNASGRVRIGAVQWQMRALASVDELIQQIDYFAGTLSSYQADAVLFPEFFNAALMAPSQGKDSPRPVLELAGHTQIIREAMVGMAQARNINIIGGSMPEYIDGTLRNVSYLCRRDGTWDRQYKIHATPFEKETWGMAEGHDVKVFDTDFGKIGILICYDSEFPELGRIMAEKGAQILCVPFWTDTRHAYQRVRFCAQARAIENECYVVLAGSTGNLPSVEHLDMQYAQSAILTPSDMAFPHDCIAAEASANLEMIVMADIDLSLLADLHEKGAVRNLKDRRPDIYAASAENHRI